MKRSPSPSICFYFICFVYLSNSPQTFGGLLKEPNCLKVYLQQLLQIHENYAYALEACNDEDNIDRRPPLGMDLEAEIDKHKNTSQQTCYDLSACNFIADAHEFFDCHSKTALTNAHKFASMNLNASSMVIELSENYQPVEKEILRCRLAAKRKYIHETNAAYNEYLKCFSV